MLNFVRHGYHLVDESPWPLFSCVSAFLLTTGILKWFHSYKSNLFILSLFCLILIMLQWWLDVSCEASYLGFHSSVVELGLRWGMLLFIVSEVFFFISFFWAFFHSSLSASVEMGSKFPPSGLSSFNPFGVPMLNTLILISSGISVTWSHHSLMSGNDSNFKLSLVLTTFLGAYFIVIQMFEYWEASFSMSDSSYGSSFFIATGFHGLHVFVGTCFLATCLLRSMVGHFTSMHHFGFEAAAWYWHFVDVVWLFLFVVIYWWGGA